MIASLAGTITEKDENRIVVVVAGIGHEVLVPATISLGLRVGAEVMLHTVEVIREDSRDLFGFPDTECRALFRRLISVSGVGPKTALLVLGNGSAAEVRSAIEEGDATRLTAVPGVGTKIAQKIILELRGKLPEMVASEDADVLEALVGLGYSRATVQQLLTSMPKTGTNTEARLKEALKLLAKSR